MITYTPANDPPCSRFVHEEWDGSEDVATERRAIEIAMLQRVFGPKWPDLKPEQQQIADLLLREIAPQRDARTRGRGAGLRLLLGRVPKSPDSTPRNPCRPAESAASCARVPRAPVPSSAWARHRRKGFATAR